MDPIRFAVIGCGNIGTRHLAVLAAEERARLVCLCDTDPAKRTALSGQYGIAATADYRDVLRRPDVDIVNIATPHGLHAEMAIEAARAGKHILVEKPMALSTADAKAMNAEAEKHGVKLMVVKQNRYNVPIALTRKALEERRLGRVFMVQCNVLWNRHEGYYSASEWRGRRALEGGALYTQVSHFIDLLIWWFGDLTSAQTRVSTMNHKIEIEDWGASTVTFASGVQGSLLWTTCVYSKNYEGSITIIGEKGTIKIGGAYLNKIEYWDVAASPLPEGVEFVDKPNAYGKYQGTSSNHDKVVHDVVASLLNERANTVSGDEGLRTIAAIEQIYRDAQHV